MFTSLNNRLDCVVEYIDYIACIKLSSTMRLFFSIFLLGIAYSMSAQKEGCFEIIYPLKFELLDGSELEVENHQAMVEYKSLWKQNQEFPSLKFPIQVKWPGRDLMVIDSQMMLDRHQARCNKYKSSLKEGCFEFIYPLTFEFANGSKVEVENHRALMKYKSSWKQKKEYPNLMFPIEVKWPGRDLMVIDSQEMLNRHQARCKKYQNR